MNLYKNARTCPRSRDLIAKRVLQEGKSVTRVARVFGISGHTVYKWVHRYRASGEGGLWDRSSCPRRLGHRLGSDWVDLIQGSL